MVNSNSKGDRRERELVNQLADHGYAVLRAPSSGSATDRDLPDILAGNGLQFLAIEAKTQANDKLYVPRRELESLEYFAAQFGAIPRLATRWDGDTTWYFHAPIELHETPKSYRASHTDAQQDAMPFRTLVERSTLQPGFDTAIPDGGDQ